jgi:hypothetical protein
VTSQTAGISSTASAALAANGIFHATLANSQAISGISRSWPAVDPAIASAVARPRRVANQAATTAAMTCWATNP